MDKKIGELFVTLKAKVDIDKSINKLEMVYELAEHIERKTERQKELIEEILDEIKIEN